MVAQFASVFGQLLLISLVGVAESVVGVPFLFYLLSFRFLHRYSLAVRSGSVVWLSVLAAVLFGVHASMVGLFLVGGMLWATVGKSILVNRAVRVVLWSFAATGMTAGAAEVLWQGGTLVYSLASVCVGVALVYWPRRWRQGVLRYWNVEV